MTMETPIMSTILHCTRLAMARHYNLGRQADPLRDVARTWDWKKYMGDTSEMHWNGICITMFYNVLSCIIMFYHDNTYQVSSTPMYFL